MAFNGAGVFNRLYSWAIDKTNGILVRADRVDAELDGIATGLSNAICKDGQTTITANIPLNSYQLTGVGNGTTAQAAATVSQVQAGAFAWNATAGGTADAINVTVSPTPGSYVAGMTIHTVPASNNTGTATLNVNGLGVKTIKVGTANLSAGDILADVPAAFIYDGTNFQMHSPSRGSLGNLSLPIPLASGGTGATTAAAARAALGTLFSNYSELGGNVTVNASYRGASLLFNATATVTFDTAANLTANFAMAIFAGAGATVTLDANGTETIDGQLTQTVSANSSAIIASTGNATAGLRLAGSSGSSGGVTETITAGEALTINATNGLAVVYKDTFNQRSGGAGKVYLVDADATGPVRVSREIGIITANISNGSTGNGYFRAATITGLASLTAGAPAFAHASTAGAIQQTEPSVPSNGSQVASVAIGSALNTTALTFAPPDDITFIKYAASLANNTTTTVEHFTDANARERVSMAHLAGGSSSNTTGTFSNTTDGGTGINSGIGYNWGMKLTIPASATQVDYFTVKMVSVSTGGDVVGKVYSNNAGSPGTQVGSDSDTQNVTSGVNYTFTFGTPVPVTGGSDYWMVFAPSASNFSATIDTTGPVAGYVSGRNNTITSITDLAGSDTRMEIGYSQLARDEPLTINADSLITSGIGVRYDNGTGGENDTKTSFRNVTAATRNIVAEITL